LKDAKSYSAQTRHKTRQTGTEDKQDSQAPCTNIWNSLPSEIVICQSINVNSFKNSQID